MTNYKSSQVLSSFYWLNVQKLEVDWVTVTDDDCFMNVQNVFDTFNGIQVSESGNQIFCGLERTVDKNPFIAVGGPITALLVRSIVILISVISILNDNQKIKQKY